MERIFSIVFCVFVLAFNTVNAQFLPHILTNAERQADYNPPAATGFTSPPASDVELPQNGKKLMDCVCVGQALGLNQRLEEL